MSTLCVHPNISFVSIKFSTIQNVRPSNEGGLTFSDDLIILQQPKYCSTLLPPSLRFIFISLQLELSHHKMKLSMHAKQNWHHLPRGINYKIVGTEHNFHKVRIKRCTGHQLRCGSFWCDNQLRCDNNVFGAIISYGVIIMAAFSGCS